MKKIFEEGTTLNEAIDTLERAGANEITRIMGNSFEFSTGRKDVPQEKEV